MFRKAYAIAQEFTLPIVLSRMDVSGRCSASIGTVTMVNDEGWFLTAFHILDAWQKMQQEAAATAAREAAESVIRNDASLSSQEKKKRIRQLGAPISATATRTCSAWVGRDDVNIVRGTGLRMPVDLGLGQLEPWRPEWTKYATIKDPTKGFQPGASLCKLGFPFHQITPTYNAQTRQFIFPPGSLPMPRFPIDGILTRFGDVVLVDQDGNAMAPPPYPWKFIETSSPGLRGQSGGPTFDVEGSVWGIQSLTRTLPLNLEAPNAPHRVREHVENQFLNIGQGVHAVTIIGLLKAKNVRFQMSAY